MANKEDTLKQIKEKMERFGDLPVFSATVNHICSLSSDPDADAMQLSQQVLKDANLSAKLLRLANSPFYNRGNGKINVISRAVIILGFESVKNLSITLKLIESFQHEHPGIDMDKLLINSFITAGFVRDLAMRCGIRDVEQTYICALLHNLGEISVAYFLPEKFIEITELNKQKTNNEKAVLGTSMMAIGKELATAWDFSSKVIATMNNDIPKITGNLIKAQEINHVLSVLASAVVLSLYSDKKNKAAHFQNLLVDISKATGILLKDVENSLIHSFEMSCELARDYGLDRNKMMPVVCDTGQEERDKLARQFSFFVSGQPYVSKQSVEAGVVVDESVNAEIQLEYIQQITTLITESAKLNTVLIKVLQGIHEALGCKRVVLCLLTPDHKKYIGRIAIGDESDAMKSFFQQAVNVQSDIFSKVAMEGLDVFVEDIKDERWQALIPAMFIQHTATQSFVAYPLRVGVKPLGFLYADTGRNDQSLSKEQHKGFVQFVAQAKLALQTCR